MSTSIPVVNRNHTLPPLLLPDLRLLDDRHRSELNSLTPPPAPSVQFTSSSDLLSGSSSTNATSKRSLNSNGNLESLANIATKRLKLSTCSKAGYQNHRHMITPPPTAPVSASISPSPSYVTFQDSDTTNAVSASSAPSGKSLSPQPTKKPVSSCNTVSSNAKRQRIGPSCDGCRLKKIKCDATIDILLQDESITSLFSEKLHHIFTKGEISENLDTVFKNLDLPKELFEEATTSGDVPTETFDTASSSLREPILIKHIDKIILFKPCNSCRKRRSSNNSHNSHSDKNCCIFSKGFTRADINVFSKISSRVKDKSMIEMDLSDYRDAGF